MIGLCESDDEWFFRGHLILSSVITVFSIFIVGGLGYLLFSYWAAEADLPMYEGYYGIQYVMVFSIGIGFRYISNTSRWLIGILSGDPFRGILHDTISRRAIWWVLIIAQAVFLLSILHLLLNERFDLLVESVMGQELENPLTPPAIVAAVLLSSIVGTALLIVDLVKTELIENHDHSAK